MKRRIVFFRMSFLLSLVCGMLLLPSITSCNNRNKEPEKPQVQNIELTGTAWRGTVATKDAKGNLIKTQVSVSFLKGKGEWHFDKNPTAFFKAWWRPSYDDMNDWRYSAFSYERDALTLVSMSRFELPFKLFQGSWIITKLTDDELNLFVNPETESRTIWLNLNRMNPNPTKNKTLIYAKKNH